ncbi:sulfatase [bacterium]|nr:sulfatase [candidate division CSSED10-310 bacterium]
MKIFLCEVFIFLGCFFSQPCALSQHSHQNPTPVLSFGTLKDMNLLMISLDTLRQDRIGTYGCPQPTSPFLNEFGKNAIVFTDMVVQYPATVQSHRSLFTSRYFYQQSKTFPDATQTLAGLLRQANWQTAAFVDSGLMDRRFGNSSGFTVYDDQGGHLAQIRQKAVRWLDQNMHKKFFLFMHTYDIHSPYDPPSPYNQLFKDVDYSVLKYNYGKILRSNAKSANESPQSAGEYAHLYDGGIRYCDSELFRFFTDFFKRGLDKNTVVVIISDHGESLGEKMYVGHGKLDDVQLYAPFMMFIPEFPSMLISNPIESIDIMPTLLYLLGVKSPDDLQGKSLIPAFTKNNHKEGVFRLSEARPKSIREDDKWKLVLQVAEPSDKLYDLENDPEELANVIDKYPDIASRLRKELCRKIGMTEENIRQMILKRPPKLRIPENDQTLEEQLKTLGYIQ